MTKYIPLLLTLSACTSPTLLPTSKTAEILTHGITRTVISYEVEAITSSSADAHEQKMNDLKNEQPNKTSNVFAKVEN